MASIRYTGVNGKSVSFSSSSPSDAMTRLSRIDGYCAQEGDRIAAGLAKGWRERHKERAAKYATKRPPFVGSTSGQRFSSGSGIVSTIPRVTDVRVKDGEMSVTTQDEFVSEGGNVVGVGAKNTKKTSVGVEMPANDVEIVSGPDSNLKITKNGNRFTVDVYYV